jgi:dihydrodipicolinate synthase/N-acetylneuraminate lyase
MSTAHREIVATWGAVGVKAALDQLGWAGGPPRPPLRPLDDASLRKLAGVLRDAGLLATAGA